VLASSNFAFLVNKKTDD